MAGGPPTPPPGPVPTTEETPPAVRGMDEYSEILGMTPREHERRMRKWFVLLAIVGFFAVFGEGILMMVARSRRANEATQPAAPPAQATEPAPTSTLPEASGAVGTSGSTMEWAESTSDFGRGGATR